MESSGSERFQYFAQSYKVSFWSNQDSHLDWLLLHTNSHRPTYESGGPSPKGTQALQLATPNGELGNTQENPHYPGPGGSPCCSTPNTQNLHGLENGNLDGSPWLPPSLPAQGDHLTPHPPPPSQRPGLFTSTWANQGQCTKVLAPLGPTAVCIPGKETIGKSYTLLQPQKGRRRFRYTGWAEVEPSPLKQQPP